MLRPSMFLRLQFGRRALHSYSVQVPKLAGVDPSKLTIERTRTPTKLGKEEDLVFGKKFTGMYYTSNLEFYSVDFFTKISKFLSPHNLLEIDIHNSAAANT
jgi:hypothetical protein